MQSRAPLRPGAGAPHTVYREMREFRVWTLREAIPSAHQLFPQTFNPSPPRRAPSLPLGKKRLRGRRPFACAALVISTASSAPRTSALKRRTPEERASSDASTLPRRTTRPRPALTRRDRSRLPDGTPPRASDHASGLPTAAARQS